MVDGKSQASVTGGKGNVRTYAHLTIREAGKMSPRGRREIAAWLIKQAETLVRDGPQYSDNFTARWNAAIKEPVDAL